MRTLIAAKSVDEFRMICLRNPWGEWEWTQDWSDKSDLWEKHPNVKDACQWEKPDAEWKEDGIFWMEWIDFKDIFNVIQVCDRSTFKDIQLDVDEELGCLGICTGCTAGCYRYWCCCAGLRQIYLGRRTRADTVDVEEGCLCCKKEVGKEWRQKTVEIR